MAAPSLALRAKIQVTPAPARPLLHAHRSADTAGHGNWRSELLFALEERESGKTEENTVCMKHSVNRARTKHAPFSRVKKTRAREGVRLRQSLEREHQMASPMLSSQPPGTTL